jgi:hypothetical protein
MENFTIHIFGYGETQINSNEFSIKVKTTDLTKVQPLVDAIWGKKPEGSLAEEKYHAINIFNHNDLRWMSKDGFELKVIAEQNASPIGIWINDDEIENLQNQIRK